MNTIITNSSQCHEIGFAKNMINAMHTRFDHFKYDTIYIISMIVDLRFKGILIDDVENIRAKSNLEIEVEKYRKGNNKNK